MPAVVAPMEPALPLSALKALRRLFSGDATASTALPEATDPLWEWLHGATSLRGREPFHVAVFTASDSPHSWVLVMADDQPFLTDTSVLALRRCDLDIEGLWHPVVSVSRSDTPKGRQLMNVAASRASTKGKQTEAWILVRVNRLDAEETAQIHEEVSAGLGLSVAVVNDFEAMAGTMTRLAKKMTSKAQKEERLFLEWLMERHMVLLGYRHYDYTQGDAGPVVKATPDSGLGILRVENSAVAKATPVADLNTSLGLYVKGPETLVLSKTPNISRVHRASSMDYVAILERDAKGHVVGEHRFLGLYTSSAYTAAVRDIPLVRAKLDAVADIINWPANSHNARSLLNILETWPRDELFLTEAETLAELTRMAVVVKERASVRILLRHSLREQAVAALVYMPLARMSTHIREEIGALLEKELGSSVQEFKVEMGVMGGESDMARIFFRLPWKGDAHLDEEALTKRITALVRGWDDEVFDLLSAAHGAATAAQWVHKYGGVAGPAYRAATPPALAAQDIAAVHNAPDQKVQVVEDGAHMRLRLFRKGECWPLSFLMPLVDSCGLAALREETFALRPAHAAPEHPTLWLHEITCERPEAFSEEGRAALETVLDHSLRGLMERDSLNWLAMSAAFGPRQIHVWRAWVMYLQQIDRRFDPRSVRHIVRRQPRLARALWGIFEALHDPDMSDRARQRTARPLEAELETAILSMPTTEEDRIWRTLMDVVQSIVRTNVWQVQSPDEALAFKLDPGSIHHMPDPKPWREMVVYHPSVVGVHLRGGPVARGGLRHSDRKHDFRTEILGLMTAQMRKNTIIVPVGAKGGFYVQAPLPADKAEAASLIVCCYKRYISALLSLTDTYDAKGQILHPRRVERYDDADPYLVVAADKGTAKYSDIANGVAAAAAYWNDVNTGEPVQGFWLDDAFASGGSKGYDHKGMAITARGAWVSVMHHLAELDALPTPEAPVSIVGIGDMAGDVFGNGLLRSPHTQLVAAFNHMHIFLDPNPDPAASFAERQRLFDAAKGWDAYDARLISEGGGVFLRKAKTIEVSPQAQARLGIAGGRTTARDMTPEDLIAAIMKAPVDVLWNGGIGTYIKASDESHLAAADKANDDVRVDAAQVRARVIGEGGNLGITPRGRVELGLKGVRLNTDALDNSAGVDTSDHEVNLKILFRQAMQKNLLDEPGRVTLLRDMTDDIARLVLDDNRLQNMVLSLDSAESAAFHAELHDWQDTLARQGYVDPIIDCLPTAKALSDREDPRYTRPELAALLAGTKAWLRGILEKDEPLLASRAVLPLLNAYFPQVVQDRFEDLIPEHPLARQLGSTQLANLLVNRLGLLAVPRLMRDFDAPAQDAARALAVALTALQAPSLWRQLDGAPAVSHATAVAVCQRLRTVIGVLAAWILRHGQPVDTCLWLKRLEGPLSDVYALLPPLLQTRPDMQKWAEEWQNLGLPPAAAARMSVMSPMAIAPDAISMAEILQHPLGEVLTLHLEVGDHLKLPALVKKIRAMELPDTWTRQAVQSIEQEIFMRQRRLTETLLRTHHPIANWKTVCGAPCHRYDILMRTILKERTITLPMLSVVLGRLRELEG